MESDKYEEYCERCGRVGPPMVFKDFGPEQGQYCWCGGVMKFRLKGQGTPETKVCPLCKGLGVVHAHKNMEEK